MKEIMSQAEIDADPEQWRKRRRDLITGTDIAGIVGADDAYGSPASVYWSKTAGIERPDSLMFVIARNDERALADLYAGKIPEAHPGYLTPGATLVQAGLCVSEDRPWQAATFDRLEDPLSTVVEFKTAQTRDGWGTAPHGEIPLRYHIQALWEADVCGADLVKLVVLFRPFGPFTCYWIPVDDDAREDIAMFRDRAERFRVDYLLPGRPPPADGKDATTLALKSAYHTVDRETVTVPKRLWTAALRAQQRVDAAKEALALAKNRIAEVQQDAEFAVTRDGQKVMQRSLSWPGRVDLKLLRADYPEAAAACTVKPPADEPQIAFLLKQPKE